MNETSLPLDLVAYSAQVVCVVAVGAALAALIRVDAAGVRYVYWRALLALCLALPWLQVRRPLVVAMPASPEIVTTSSDGVAAAAGTSLVSAATTDWVAVGMWILAAGVVFRICRVGVGLWRLRRLRRAGWLAPACDAHHEAQQLIQTSAEIRYVPGGQPVTFGFRHPVVLLPDMLRSRSASVQRVVLCHELLHVRRRDWIWVVAEEAVKAVLWFHPAVLWLISQVRQAREELVDELTVLATSDRRAYLEALLAFADAPTRTPTVAFARRKHLFMRMVLISKEAVMSSKRILASVAVMAALVAAAAWSAVSVFPLTETVVAQGRVAGAAVAPASQAGPLERQAKAITPENPIPRRTFSVSPQNPSDGVTGVVMVSIRVVVDRQGRVAEVRSAGVGARGGRAGSTPQPVPPPNDAFAKAAIDAVRQWQYDPPADGPIAFDVTFAFGQNAEPRLVSHGLPVSVGGPSAIPTAPPPPPPPPGWAAGAVRIGGSMKPPQKVKHIAPVYPAMAQSARVQGVVILEAIIGPDGHVMDARVLRSIPLLDQAALDAVRQWEFTPTRLNGTPVPVIMTVTVQFSLS